MKKIPNAERMKDKHFLECCEKAGVEVTRRQASKFQNGYGAAFQVHRQIADGNRKGK